ncbi:MAG TPA: DNA primase [Abditibacteriaceae bacterium]|jgi:DNA primase catalytic core
MAYDDSTEEIRRRADIVEVIEQFVALRPAGNNRFKACCPFHDEKTPSFYVSRDKGFYKCFGCGESGDSFKFLQKIENLSFVEAKRQLAEKYGIELRAQRDLSPEQQVVLAERDRLYKVMASAAAFFREQYAKHVTPRDYARKRGLSQGTIEKFGIGYAPDEWESLRKHLVNRYGFSDADGVAVGLLIEKEDDTGRKRYYDRYRHRLMFPIWDMQGRVIAFGGRALEDGKTGNPDAKYINSPESPLFTKSKTLYGWHIARSDVGKQESVILNEGYMDSIALHEAGFGNAIATLGTALTVHHAGMLARLSPKVVYLCYDGDSAGMQAALRAAPIFAAHNLDVRVVILPGGDDPDTFVRKAGKVGFQNALREARMLLQYRVEMALGQSDLSNAVERTQAIKAASDIIAEMPQGSERATYVAWLAEQWARAENISTPDRLRMVEAAVAREVEISAKRWEKQETVREERQQRWQKRDEKPQVPSENAQTERADVVATLSEAALNQSSGVLKAEECLIASLINAPTWRGRILEQLPLEKWTSEIHGEIVALLRRFPGTEPIDMAPLLDQLSPEAQGLVSSLMLTDEAQTPPELRVIDDWIARVQGHWLRQTERESLESIRLKLERGEPITEEEKDALASALRGTKRMTGRPPGQMNGKL